MKALLALFFVLVFGIVNAADYIPTEREFLLQNMAAQRGNLPGPDTASGLCQRPLSPVKVPRPLPLKLELALIEATAALELVAKKLNQSSLTAALVYDQDILWSFAEGQLDPKQPSRGKATIDSIYRIGSLSKMFTCLMLLKLRDQGKVLLDEEVRKYWPNFTPERFQNSRGITFFQLARQLSGLPSGSPCSYFNNSCDLSTNEAFKRLSAIGQTLPSDFRPHYSDLAYAVLGRALEKVAGKTWEEYMTQEIIKPLQLTSTGFDINPSIISRMPVPFLVGKRLPPVLSFTDMLWARPTGQMFSSVRDLAKLATMFFKDLETPQNPVLKDSSLREIMLPGFINNDQISGYGFPWEIVFNKAAHTYLKTKGGFFPGYTASIMLDPTTKIGVVALSNDVLAIAASTLIVDFVFRPLKEYIIENQPPVSTPSNSSAFVGTYNIDQAVFPGFNFPITVSLNKTVSPPYLALSLMTANYSLVWEHDNLFHLDIAYPLSCSMVDMGAFGEPVIFLTKTLVLPTGENSTIVTGLRLPATDPYTQYTFSKRN